MRLSVALSLPISEIEPSVIPTLTQFPAYLPTLPRKEIVSCSLGNELMYYAHTLLIILNVNVTYFYILLLLSTTILHLTYATLSLHTASILLSSFFIFAFFFYYLLLLCCCFVFFLLFRYFFFGFDYIAKMTNLDLLALNVIETGILLKEN